MTQKKRKQVSIIGEGYFQPIANLIEHWLKFPRRKPNAVQSGYYESGYAASVILLLVAMFESYIVRVRYVNRHKIPKNINRALDVLNHLYPQIRNTKALTEIYVIRDALIHNHLWEIEYSWGGNPPMKLHGAEKDSGSGDRKFINRVNTKTRRTKALKLSVVPTRVNRVDTRKIFQTIWKTLLFLESQDRFQCYVSHLHIRFKGKAILFSDLINELQ